MLLVCGGIQWDIIHQEYDMAGMASIKQLRLSVADCKETSQVVLSKAKVKELNWNWNCSQNDLTKSQRMG